MQQAFWIDRSTVAVPASCFKSGWTFSLASFPLFLSSARLTPAQGQQFPQLRSYVIFQLSASIALATLKQTLRGPLTVSAVDNTGASRFTTGVQIAGVLDDLYYYPGALGALFQEDNSIVVKVWAPTALTLKLQLFHNAGDAIPATILPMTEEDGVWSAHLGAVWTDKYYLLAVQVYVPSLNQMVESLVTDPYSVDLALNGAKTRLTNLESIAHKPPGWDTNTSPHLDSINDLTIYELHLRDFSSHDPSVTPPYRGTYLAFADTATYGMQHLRDLTAAGLKALHLLPTFHIASINEDKSTWVSPGDLSIYPPDSAQQQAAVSGLKGKDGYNWGYDPVHYMAPAGAYSFNPDHRVIEYRQMVQAIHGLGLRVFQDVVFNHTAANGQAIHSVLDKIVPSYYHRLDADGNVTNSSCCSDTASEHRMMEKLVIDTLVLQARHYKIDGFRFDLMSFHFLANMQRIQQALASPQIYLYGEGWTIGETANNKLGLNASQANMYGTGIGTFNDRIRDAIRGGGPFSDHQVQGFATGSPSLENADWIRAGLAGNLRDFRFTDRSGKTIAASELIYAKQPVGYTAAPAENVVFASVHDNQTLFDAIQIKTDLAESIDHRTRRQILANSIVALAQGIPFFQAGDDLLRSKSMDNNSYSSGDWFNKIDFTFQTNNWGIGLPVASENEKNWPIMQPLLANPALRAAPAHIALTRKVFQEFLSIRASSPLFRMATLAEVQGHLQFLNTGPHQTPSFIVMMLKTEILVVFNAAPATVTFTHDKLRGLNLMLHPIQVRSADAVVQQSTFNKTTGTTMVPALTTAVFVSAPSGLP